VEGLAVRFDAAGPDDTAGGDWRVGLAAQGWEELMGEDVVAKQTGSEYFAK
jgi:hypothetical protein